MHRMMRSLKASSRSRERLAGRGSPQVADAPPAVISALPLGSTDGTGQNLTGAITGIEAQTQAQQVADYRGILQYLAPKCYGIRGSFVSTNRLTYSNSPKNVAWANSYGAIITENADLGPYDDGQAYYIGGVTGAGWVNGLSHVTTGLGINVGDVIIYSQSFKKDTGTGWMRLKSPNGNTHTYFDLNTGTIGTMTAEAAWITPEANGYYRCSYRVTITALGTLDYGESGGNNNGAGSGGYYYAENAQITIVTGLPVEQQIPAPYVGHTLATPVTTCFDKLPDGSQLRPFFTFAQTMRYDVFRPTELARNMVFNVGECIEAVASDGIRRYYRMVGTVSGTQLVPNGDFLTDTSGWANWYSATSTWQSPSNVLFANGAQNTGQFYKSISLTVGKRYVGFSESTPNTGDGTHSLLFGSYAGDSTFGGVTGKGNISCIIDGLTAPSISICSQLPSVLPYDIIQHKLLVYEILAATSGTTGATSPTFPPSGYVIDGGVLWEATGYATIMGLELDDAGSVNHPEGVRFQLDATNILADSQIIALDIFPDVAEARYGFTLTTGPTCNVMFNTDRVQFTVNAQTRAGNVGKLPGIFTRALARMNTVNAILYNDGAMFTGATGGPITPSTFTIGDAQGPTFNFTGCILNFCVLTNSAMSDANAIARSRYDLKPSVAFNADLNAEMANV